MTVRVDRAEPQTGSGDRPAGAFCEEKGNILVTWPTKLALAPDLADKVLEKVAMQQSQSATGIDLPHPGIGRAPWDID